MSDSPNEQTMRHRLRAELPADTFAPQPLRVLWTLPIVASIAGGTWAIVALDPAWYWALPLALLLGNSYAMMGLLAHEVLHGATVQSTRLENAIGYLGFGPFLVSPHLWRVWHNQVHHGNTNSGNRDPDSFGTLGRYVRMPSTRFVTQLAPGSGKWWSYLFLGYWFTFHGQVVLWVQTKYMHGFEQYDRRRAILDTGVVVLLWTLLGVAVGPVTSIFVIAIPMTVANFIAMSYIATNHFLRPQAADDVPLRHSMSVTTWPLLDRLHFHFSHHVEHHLFPRMAGNRAPRVRRWLQAQVPAEYLAPPHWKAVLYLYKTPRVYRDPETLCDPSAPEQTVDIAQVTEALQYRPAA